MLHIFILKKKRIDGVVAFSSIYCIFLYKKYILSSHIYLYSTFNNTDCVKALNNIKLEGRVSIMYNNNNNNNMKHSIIEFRDVIVQRYRYNLYRII